MIERARSDPLVLNASESPAFEIISGRLDAGVLFLCDHASNAVPAELGNLGLTESERTRHIAYDIGAAALARALASAFHAPALLTRFSRLVIDPNRGADDPTLVMRLSDRAIVPGNARIDQAEIERRRRLYWEPYRVEAGRLIDRMIARGPNPAVLSIHSFTPNWRGTQRPWSVGVLWDCDPRIALPLIQGLRDQDLVVGDNEPYDGALAGDTLDHHGNERGLAHALIEVRQDLVHDRVSAEAWAARIAIPLSVALARPEAHEIRFYPSRNGVRGSATGGQAR